MRCVGLCGSSEEMDGFVSRLDNQRGVLAGNITINCSFGFGHKYIAEGAVVIYDRPILILR